MRPLLFVVAYLPGLIAGVAALYFGHQSGYGPFDFVPVFKELTK